MESSKTTKIVISLNREEIQILENARKIIRVLSGEAERCYEMEEADEVLLTDLTRTTIDDLYSMLDDIMGLCR